MLNLNGSLTKAGLKYSTLRSEDFTDEYFLNGLATWLKTGVAKHKTGHVKPLAKTSVPTKAKAVAAKIGADLRRRKAILGVFDEGCMGMFNAIIPDDLLFSTGVYKERLSQSALYYGATQVSEAEARKVYAWYPGRFRDDCEATAYFEKYFDWYNHRHYHSGIDYVTPAQAH